jgi:aspartate aminotransferase
VKQYTSLASYSPSMYAMVKFLATEMKEKYLQEMVIPLYKKRMEFMGSCLKKYLPEAKTVKPAGAFYYFVDMRKYLSDTNTSDEEFCQRLLREKNVVVIPGSYFGVSGKQHVRMTFVSESKERTEAGIKAISEIL